MKLISDKKDGIKKDSRLRGNDILIISESQTFFVVNLNLFQVPILNIKPKIPKQSADGGRNDNTKKALQKRRANKTKIF